MGFWIFETKVFPPLIQLTFYLNYEVNSSKKEDFLAVKSLHKALNLKNHLSQFYL